ncbi:hypothetical protein B0H67DRAFT_581256 [Lasiosphaeris hirsuta]|uniref:Rhodopsin domain-containing protein n=1 Tax=Lasiosphaeris hirsuta TaxID=260670 RepID=A0AA40AH36_9PEZI|nr:hypothetical protein B0H67DRAFT_581256 [Lasiosphaeris hirsuta]
MDDDIFVTILAFSIISVVVLICRLTARRLQKVRFDTGDYLALLGILVWGCFLGVVPGVILLGTNNMTSAARAALVPGSDEVARREMGSKLLLADRVMYISTLWVSKGIIWAFYASLITQFYSLRILRISSAGLVVTYIVTILTTLLECKPLRLYWQVIPDPGTCVRALIQLWCVGGLNIGTDLLLMGLLIPVLVRVQLPWYKKLGLSFLFCMGTFLVAITAVRIAMTVSQSHSQLVRSLWGTAEMLCATCVANAPAFYASIRKWYMSSSCAGRRRGAANPPGTADLERGGVPAALPPTPSSTRFWKWSSSNKSPGFSLEVLTGGTVTGGETQPGAQPEAQGAPAQT